MLHPQSPLSLTDGQTVRLQILTLEASSYAEKIVQSLVAAGLVTPPQHKSDVEPVREEAWRELTQRLEALPSKPKSRNHYRRTRFNVSVTSVDSSALIKQYVPETGSAWIQALSAPQESNLLFISRITWVEVLSALARREREGTLTPTDKALIIQRFRFDLNNQYQVIELDAKLTETAGQLVGQYPLRAYDAIQLASMLKIQPVFSTEQSISLIFLT